MIIARTVKGKGVPAVENKNGWHGKVLKKEDVDEAIRLLQPLDKSVRGEIAGPEDTRPEKPEGSRSMSPLTRWARKWPRERPTVTR